MSRRPTAGRALTPCHRRGRAPDLARIPSRRPPHPPGPPPYPPYHPGYWPGPYYPGSWWGPAAAGAAVGAAVTAAAIGSYVYSLPDACAQVFVNGVAYQHCGPNWYLPQFEGGHVVYQVVVAPN